MMGRPRADSAAIIPGECAHRSQLIPWHMEPGFFEGTRRVLLCRDCGVSRGARLTRERTAAFDAAAAQAVNRGGAYERHRD